MIKCICNYCGKILKEEESLQVAENIHFCDKECETANKESINCGCPFCQRGK